MGFAVRGSKHRGAPGEFVLQTPESGLRTENGAAREGISKERQDRFAVDPRFLAIARLVRPQGRRGEIAAEILTDVPDRFQALPFAFLEEPGSEPQPVTVENAWLHKGRVILKFSGIDSIDAADHLRGRHVLIERSQRAALPPHQYYTWELQGCRVVRDLDGVTVELGVVTEVEPLPGGYLLHVSPAGWREESERTGGQADRVTASAQEEILIPLAQEICKRIDTEAKLIVVDPPQDLLELNH